MRQASVGYPFTTLCWVSCQLLEIPGGIEAGVWLPTQHLSITPSEFKCCDGGAGPVGSEEGPNPPGVSREGSLEVVSEPGLKQ